MFTHSSYDINCSILVLTVLTLTCYVNSIHNCKLKQIMWNMNKMNKKLSIKIVSEIDQNHMPPMFRKIEKNNMKLELESRKN